MPPIMAGRKLAVFALVAAFAASLVGCGVSDTRYYLGAFDQNPELRELFHLFEREKDQENRFVLISQIAAGLANEGRVDREILFLTNHVEKNPADIYNGYYLLLVADAYRDMKAAPGRALLSQDPSPTTGTSSSRARRSTSRCPRSSWRWRPTPRPRSDTTRSFSPVPTRARHQLVLHGQELRGRGGMGAIHPGLSEVHRERGRRRERDIDDAPRRFGEGEFYECPDKSWLVPDLDDLVAAVRDAITTKNTSKLRKYQAQVNFFQEPWDQTQLLVDEIVNYNVTSYLSSSNVTIDSQLDINANGKEATLRTTGWNFRPSTWYLYFREVDFPAIRHQHAVGMGRHLLRRKALSPRLPADRGRSVGTDPRGERLSRGSRCAVSDGTTAPLVAPTAAPAVVPAGGAVPVAADALAVPGAPAAVVSADTAPVAALTVPSDGPLPPAQGIEAAEFSSLAIPDEDMISNT